MRAWVEAGASYASEPLSRAARRWIGGRCGRSGRFRHPNGGNPGHATDLSDWIKTPIDAFILAGLTAKGLAPAPAAGPATLIRRVTFDLTGLPPTPEAVDAFVADMETDPRAFETLVDKLLASPQYGERWGRHWLDVVRFGESQGYETNLPRPNAWPYSHRGADEVAIHTSSSRSSAEDSPIDSASSTLSLRGVSSSDSICFP